MRGCGVISRRRELRESSATGNRPNCRNPGTFSRGRSASRAWDRAYNEYEASLFFGVERLRFVQERRTERDVQKHAHA
jgi:hypothetical protein